jgi:AbrB family looped-hinge helix DNA binding protein
MKSSTKLTTKGQVVIPKRVRDRLRWAPGMRLEVDTVADGVVLSALKRRRSRDFEALLQRVSGFLTKGDPLADLEADHAAEVKADERRRS